MNKNNNYNNIKTDDRPQKNNIKKINKKIMKNYSAKKENIENEDDNEEKEEDEEENENNIKEKKYSNKYNNKYGKNCYKKQKRERSAQKSSRLNIFSSTFFNNNKLYKKPKKIQIKYFTCLEIQFIIRLFFDKNNFNYSKSFDENNVFFYF